jgi:hypothetical protein
MQTSTVFLLMVKSPVSSLAKTGAGITVDRERDCEEALMQKVSS